jgi:hypothetical protein
MRHVWDRPEAAAPVLARGTGGEGANHGLSGHTSAAGGAARMGGRKRASDAQDARRSVLLFTSTSQWRDPGTCSYSDPAESAARGVRETPAYAALARLCVSRGPDSSALRAALSSSPRFWPLPRRREPARFTSRAVTATPRASMA